MKKAVETKDFGRTNTNCFSSCLQLQICEQYSKLKFINYLEILIPLSLSYILHNSVVDKNIVSNSASPLNLSRLKRETEKCTLFLSLFWAHPYSWVLKWNKFSNSLYLAQLGSYYPFMLRKGFRHRTSHISYVNYILRAEKDETREVI